MENIQNYTGLTVKEEMELRAKICQKIVDMSKAIGKLKNDGTNKQQGYPYISAEQMKAELREKCSEFGLCIIPSVIDRSEEKTEKADKINIRTSVVMSFDIIDTETGYKIVSQFTGSDQDYGGKSEQQAITQCNKYFLFNLFKISTKDEQDGDSKTTESNNTKSVAQQKQNTQQKETAQIAKKVDLTEKSLAIVIEKVKVEGHKVWETNKTLYNFTPEQEKLINETKVILTAEKVETIITAIKSGKTTVWEKNKAKYEYTAEQEAQITQSINLVISEKDKTIAEVGDNFVGDTAKVLLNN